MGSIYCSTGPALLPRVLLGLCQVISGQDGLSSGNEQNWSKLSYSASLILDLSLQEVIRVPWQCGWEAAPSHLC